MPVSKRKRKSKYSTSSPLSRKKPTIANAYPNDGNFLEQTTWKGCKTCIDGCNSSCTCQLDGKHCGPSCACPPDCAHRIHLSCSCRGPCGKACRCLKGGYACEKERCACGCAPLHLRPFPGHEVKESGLLGAGQGYYATEPIRKGTVFGLFEGSVVRHNGETDYNLFDLAEGYSLRCKHEGTYYINEKRHKDANAAFQYIEGPRRREVVAIATKNIQAGEEVFAQYTATDHAPCFLTTPLVGEYVLADANGEPWLGQVTKVYPRKREILVDWLLRKQDLHHLPNEVATTLDLEPGEVIKTRWWSDSFGMDYVIQTVLIGNQQPEGGLSNNSWWWGGKVFNACNWEIENKANEKGTKDDGNCSFM
ncbi:hypothetical protein P154DRAFT_620557 [Amniculicola lignicola CBS 123094]|uniref:SET domain-containing protein n=1 Tax=Amniculicola lignicola CBS 123094 TaxID=1392246 RepID=A0A6A5WFL3_9PLEO|nr:hypothetical protein P154DRAFT_620557 [Amniculicola lignicola CBS 123094]